MAARETSEFYSPQSRKSTKSRDSHVKKNESRRNTLELMGKKASESGCRREGSFETIFHNTDDSKTDESSRAAVQPQARRQASASFADLRYCTEYRVKGDQFHHTNLVFLIFDDDDDDDDDDGGGGGGGDGDDDDVDGDDDDDEEEEEEEEDEGSTVVVLVMVQVVLVVLVVKKMKRLL
ncbi:hypothetical protein ElyMa_000742700 [Elysia marginata]|uniref:Uncharacterized protein n=1 Tax=Elysia marginata TaxID=1093978 RepID=A0AAV4GPS4_9GAST|nr:hypothetical protein ElyMa_000742700 [Elysia marginata]